MTTTLFGWVTFIYLGAFVLHVLHIVLDRESFRIAGLLCAASGLAAQSAAIVLRWVESYRLGIGHAPLSNFYESLVFFAWAIVTGYLVLQYRHKGRELGAFCLPIAFLLLAYASFSPAVDSQIRPLIPALKSNWLISHVITCFLGYAAFVIASIFGAFYLIRPRFGTTRLPERALIEDLIYQSVIIGFILFTIGIMTGSVWAYSAWGRYWGWDPKETWALITWIIYASLLHARLQPTWRGRRIAVLSLIGLASVIFTYLGVNYLPGLHSYL